MQLEIPTYSYDESSVGIPTPIGNNTARSNQLSFPLRLYAMLESSLYEEIVGWLSNGRDFKIHNMERFENEVIPQHFSHANFGSFQRQLNLYGFRRVLKGPNSGAFQHPHFLKGRYDLVLNINRSPTSFRSVASSGSSASSLTCTEGFEGQPAESSKRLREEVVATPTDELISVLLKQMYTHPNATQSYDDQSDVSEMNIHSESRFSDIFIYKDLSRSDDNLLSNSKASVTTHGSDDSSDPFELLQCHTDRGSDADSIFNYTESGDGSRRSPPLESSMTLLSAGTRRRKTPTHKQKQKAASGYKKGTKTPRALKDRAFFPVHESAITEITLDPSILSQYGEIYYVPTDGSNPVRIKAVNVPIVSQADPLSARSANTCTTGSTSVQDSASHYTSSDANSAPLSPSQRKSDDIDVDSSHGYLESPDLFQLPALSFHD